MLRGGERQRGRLTILKNTLWIVLAALGLVLLETRCKGVSRRTPSPSLLMSSLLPPLSSPRLSLALAGTRPSNSRTKVLASKERESNAFARRHGQRYLQLLLVPYSGTSGTSPLQHAAAGRRET